MSNRFSLPALAVAAALYAAPALSVPRALEAQNAASIMARVRAILGTADVERLDVAPDLARHDAERLRPVEAIRVGERFFVRVREHPNDWWMSELDENGELRSSGVYGANLEEAVRHR